MGASIRRKGGGPVGGRLRAHLSNIAKRCNGVHVVAGFISGLSSPENIHKAYVNNFGTEGTGEKSSVFGKKIPARPFMEQSVPLIREQVAFMADSFDLNDVAGSMDFLGAGMKGSIKNSIETGNFEPNAEMTVKMKGFDKPLTETGSMAGDVQSEVRRS